MAHIGVLQALKKMQYPVHAVAGCSMGALVGAAYASNTLDALEQQVITYTRSSIWRLFEISWPRKGGLTKGTKVMKHLEPFIVPSLISQLPVRYGAVACTMQGKEVWMTDGLLTDAVRASISLPVLFSPAWNGKQWLMDGAVVNPLPISLCRALGVDIVIAVRIVPVHNFETSPIRQKDGARATFLPKHPNPTVQQGPSTQPSYLNALGSAVDTLVGQVGSYRLKAEPANFVLDVPIEHMGLLDFHLGQKAIDAGRSAVHRAQSILQRFL